MPCMALGESSGVFRCCNDADYQGCNRIGVRESDEDTEGWSYRYQYRVIVGERVVCMLIIQ